MEGFQWERLVKVVKLKMDTSLVYVQIIPHFKCLSVAIFVKVTGRILLFKMVPYEFVRLRIDCEVPKLTASEMEFISVKAMKEGGGLIVKLRQYDVTKSGTLRSYKRPFAVV